MPGRLVDAGAKFFVALANHHDGFNAWTSTHHPWNALAIAPHRDGIGTRAAEARKANLSFGVTGHQTANWRWLQAGRGADASAPLAGHATEGRLTLTGRHGKRSCRTSLKTRALNSQFRVPAGRGYMFPASWPHGWGKSFGGAKCGNGE